MKLTTEEVAVLVAYLDETTINLTRLQKKIGLEKIRLFNNLIDKIYEHGTKS